MSDPAIDLSFRRYVARRRSQTEARRREGEAYAFGGDLRVRRTLGRLRPVTLAIEATVRLWRGVSRAELLGTAVKVSDRQFPRIHAACARAAEALRVPPPTLYVSPKLSVPAQTLGTPDEALVVLSTASAEGFSDDALAFVLGRECAHLQNDHVLYTTALYHLSYAAQHFVRWVVKPAVIALRAWARRAEITCDRAGLCVLRDLGLAERALVQLTVGSSQLAAALDVEEYLKQLDEQRASVGRWTEMLAAEPYLPKRLAALRTFAASSYYRSLLGEASGLSAEECDKQTAELLGVMR